MVHIVKLKVLRVYIEASEGQRVGVDQIEERSVYRNTNSTEPI